MLRHVAAFAACSFLAVGTACSSASSPSDEDVGEATAAITQVPAQVGCVEIDVTGARSVTNRTNVTPGTNALISLTGLPLGLDTFVGLAYPGACNAVTSASQATWISNAVQASLTAQQVASVSLTLVPNGQSSVGVSFQPDDAGADAKALTCSTPQILCSGVCTNVATDPANCGACGEVCAAGQSCTSAVCTVAGSCMTDTNCATSSYCQSSSHTCVAKQGTGTMCTAADQCLSGLCTAGLCN
jgi:hypothetical protein